jgi:hypothetical protein
MLFRFKARSFFEKNIKKLFWIPVAAVFSLAAIFSFMQYRVWLDNEMTKYLLPPHSGIGYFAIFAFFRFFAPYILSFILSALLSLAMIRVNKRSGGKFFEDDEIYIAFLGGFLSGYPGFIFYLVGLVFVYLIIHLSKTVIGKKGGLSRSARARSEVIPLYNLWLPVSASVIIIYVLWLSHTALWKLLSL